MSIKKCLNRVTVEVSVLSLRLRAQSDSHHRENWIRQAKAVEREIHRHVDSIGSTRIVMHETEYCEFCGHPHNEPYDCCRKSWEEIKAKEKEEFGL